MKYRFDIIEQAIIECLNEMYINSQPSITWEDILEQAKKEPKRCIWQEHYLPKHLYERILERYKQMYRIGDEWTGNIELLERYLTEGGTRDKYIEAHTDEYGYHPGYRGYEKVESVKNQIQEILKEYIGCNNCEAIRDKITEAVMNTISDCKIFYNHNREELKFLCSIANYSPNSNIEAVRAFYKDTDIIINEIEDNEDE